LPPEDDYEPENAGPLSDQVRFSISEDGLEAYIISEKPLGKSVKVQDIKYLLRKNEILYGIKDNKTIGDYLKKKSLHVKPWLIAEGKRPTPPKDGSIKFFFEAQSPKKPTTNNDDSKDRVDFKDRGVIPYVQKGDLIGERQPGIPGSQGIDIKGKPIKTKKPKQASLRTGEGVDVEDNRLAYAKISGMPIVKGPPRMERLHVIAQYFVNGNVGITSGNVIYGGPVVVKGTVESGYTVKAESLQANEVEKATLDIKGDVEISIGIIGSKIKSMGKVKAKFIKGAKIEAAGDIEASGGIIDSKIETSGRCTVEKGKILTSTVCAYGGVLTRDLGSYTSTECKIMVGVDPATLRTLKVVEEELEVKKKELAKLNDSGVPINVVETKLLKLNEKIEPLETAVANSNKVKPALVQKIHALKKSGAKAELQKMLLTLKDVETKFQAATEKLKILTAERDELSKELSTVVNLKTDIDEATDKIQELKDSIKEEFQEAPVTIPGNAFKGNIIQGINSKLEIPDDTSGIIVMEIHKELKNNEIESTMVLTKAS